MAEVSIFRITCDSCGKECTADYFEVTRLKENPELSDDLRTFHTCTLNCLKNFISN